jgi:hypothetical protein
MGHKGPVLRPRCISSGRARTQIPFKFPTDTFSVSLYWQFSTFPFVKQQLHLVVCDVKYNKLVEPSKVNTSDHRLRIHRTLHQIIGRTHEIMTTLIVRNRTSKTGYFLSAQIKSGARIGAVSSVSKLQAGRSQVIGIFLLTQSFRPHCGTGVDSSTNRNEYQEYLLG